MFRPPFRSILAPSGRCTGPEERPIKSHRVYMWVESPVYTRLHAHSSLSQNPKDIDRFEEFLNALEGLYVDGRPLHVAAPSKSAVAVYTESEFVAMGDRKVLDVLRDQHIVITDMPKEPFLFDEDGLSALKPISSPVTIQGKAIVHLITVIAQCSRHTRSIHLHYRRL